MGSPPPSLPVTSQDGPPSGETSILATRSIPIPGLWMRKLRQEPVQGGSRNMEEWNSDPGPLAPDPPAVVWALSGLGVPNNLGRGRHKGRTLGQSARETGMAGDRCHESSLATPGKHRETPDLWLNDGTKCADSRRPWRHICPPLSPSARREASGPPGRGDGIRGV